MGDKDHIKVNAVITLKALSMSQCIKKYSVGQCTSELVDDYILNRNDPLHLELLSTQLDPNSVDERAEKPPLQARSYEYLHQENEDAIFGASFDVPKDFGRIGAILVQNMHSIETLLKSVVLHELPDNSMTNFSCNSWIRPSGNDPLEKRIFFSNKSYLQHQTPEGLVERRSRELENLRGDGTGERQSFERIYDYDVYNDLGDPDSNVALKRSVLGGSQIYPYPRRCRTGRPKSIKDPSSETRIKGSLYVPRDEQFGDTKGSNFSMNVLKAVLHSLIPSLEASMEDTNMGFSSFEAINALFSEGINLPRVQHQGDLTDVLPRLLKPIPPVTPITPLTPIDTNVERDLLLFDRPDMFERDTFGWLRDEEFARQTLAGTNPCGIKLVKEWPILSKLDAKIYGSPISAITTEHIQPGIIGSVERDIEEKKLFVLDFHDLLMPYVNKVRDVPGTTLYASRTLFYLTHEGMLKPLAIELSRPPSEDKPLWRKVYTPSLDGTRLWLWRLAKAHVLAHDSAHHQLVSHWLRAHCSTEPYIIAANRQLSAMHPIYRLLLPHFRYNMEINALARESLINAEGVIESVFAARKYAMELSSCVYRDEWRFDLQGLPADLISRGMAEESRFGRHGLKLVIEDYPFANDGLLLWDAIKEWITAYVNFYYAQDDHWLLSGLSHGITIFQRGVKALTGHRDKDSPLRNEKVNVVRSDEELNNWWTEIQQVGHGDKNGKPGWPKLETREDLIGILTTIIWVSSGHHAAVNFGQYGYSAYIPNRPTIARTKMPDEDPSDEEELRRFAKKPENALLESFPSMIQATKEMAIVEVLSSHSPDEEYIGKTMEKSWEEEEEVKKAFERFQMKLKKMEEEIDARNGDKKKKNRVGAGIVPYQLLKPFSEQGVTGMGVPNSISI